MRRSLVAVCVLGAVALTAAPATALSARAAEQGTVQELDNKDAEVFMDVDASAGEIAAVRRAIRRSPLVTRWAFIDKDAAYKIFKRIFRDQPDKVNSITPADLPVSFPVRLRSPERSAAQFLFAFDQRAGVDKAVSPIIGRRTPKCRADVPGADLPEGDLEAFMRVGASEAQVAAARVALLADPSVASVEQVTPDQALRITRCIFRGASIVKELTAADLPTSYRINLLPGANKTEAQARLSPIAGVDQVKIGS